MLLLVAVMTAHSCTEGISIGISYAGSHGQALGHFMSSILALHNVPEGLATALVLVPHGVPPVEAACSHWYVVCIRLPGIVADWLWVCSRCDALGGYFRLVP